MDAHTERIGDLRMCGELCPPRRWHRIVCVLMEIVLTNNGAVPKEKITEGGGLSMLRQRIEEAGGKMEVWSIPRFKLMLRLPEQEEAAHESDDR